MRFTSSLLATLLVVLSTSAQAQILIGQTAGFTGSVAAGVKETTDGARLYIDAINAKGGVNGQKIELLSLDDKFDPKLAAENARQLIEEKNVVALFLTRGTPHTEAIVPLLDKHGVPLIGPSTGAMSLHQPVRRHVFNVRATYQREAEKAVLHLATSGMNKMDATRIHELLTRHFKYTGSSKAKTILDNWAHYLPLFVKVMPVEYARALADLEKAQETSNGLTVGVKRA